MWLIGGILVGSLGGVRSFKDDGCIDSAIENSVLYYGRERGGGGYSTIAAFRTFGSQDEKGGCQF